MLFPGSSDNILSLGLIRLQQLFQAVNIGEITLDIDVKRVTDINDAYLMLKDLHQKDEKANLQVFLDLATKKAEEIIVRIVSLSFVYISACMLEVHIAYR